jgi:hypothetical protein
MRIRATIALCAALCAASAASAQERSPVFGLDEVERGIRGYGLSVFSGTVPERFEVEVIGVVRNLHPETSFILARLTGHDLERSGVVAGMSGSPVYLDDRLAGAVAFSWSYSQDAIAGITPIAAMRDLANLPTSAPVTPPPTVEVAQLLTGQLPEDLLDRHLEMMLPRSILGTHAQLQFGTTGFGDASRDLLERVLGPVAPAGSSPDLEAELEGGSAVAGVLIGGDFELAVTGTVTERDGDELTAFGHAYLGLGPINIPMATAEVLTVISSRASSFKLANVGPVVGAFEEDRLVGMLGRVGATAPTIPLTIHVGGEPERDYELQVARIPLSTPMLSAVAVLEAMDAARHQGGDQDIEMKLRVQLAGHAPLELAQHFSGNSAAVSSALYVLSTMSFLMHDPTEEVDIESVEVDLRQQPSPRTVTLVGAHASQRNVRAGDTLQLHLDLRHYRGEAFRRSIDVTIPDDLAPGPYFLFAGDGAAVDTARLEIEPWEPKDLSGSLAMLRSFHHPGDLVLMGAVRSRGLLVEGRTMPSLPGSIRSIWSAAGPLAAKGLGLSVHDQRTVALDFPLDGAARIDLRVLPKAD